MNNKMKIGVMAAVILLLLVVFIFQKNFVPKGVPIQDVISVKSVLAQKSKFESIAEYVGVVKGESLSKLSFQVPGKIKAILSNPNDLVKKGAQLAQIEPDRLELGALASQSQVVSASNQVNKAQEGYDFAQNQLQNVTALFASGGASQNDLDKATLNLELSKADLNSAKEQKRLAQVQGQQNQLNLNDTTLLAPFDGYVVDWLTKVGETTGAGYPVLVFRSPGQMIEFGVAQKDFVAFKVGTEVTVMVDEKAYIGRVTAREAYPNAETRTYAIQVVIDKAQFPIGALCTVKVVTHVVEGVKLPIMALLYNEHLQVFQVTDQKVALVDVEILELMDDYVIVKGLDNGMNIVTEGIKRLKVGDIVVLLK